jgi:hypothetical protein
MECMLLLDDETGRRLLVNDPAVKFVRLSDTTSEQNVSALCHSTHIEHLDIDMQVFQTDTALNQVLKWLEATSTLSHLRMCHSGSERSRQAASDVLRLLFQAIVGSGQRGRSPEKRSLASIACIGLNIVAEDLIALLNGENPPLRQLLLAGCHITPGSFQSHAEAMRQVSQWFALHPALQELTFGIDPQHDEYFCSILDALQTNTRIEALMLAGNRERSGPLLTTVSDAMVRFFQTSICSLRSVAFAGFSWTGDSMAALAQSLQASSMHIEDISFRACHFDDDSCAHLCSMFARGSLTPFTLNLHGDVVFPKSKDYLTNLVANFPADLRELRLNGFCDSSAAKKRLRTILRGMTMDACSIHRLSLVGLCGSTFAGLLRALPKLKHLKFLSCMGFQDTRDGSFVEADIVTAFRRNRSLLGSNIPPVLAGAFSPVRHRLVRAYHKRNRNLQQQVSGAVEALVNLGSGASLLPILFKVDETTGHGPQQALAALVRLGDRVGPKEIAKKRMQAATL